MSETAEKLSWWQRLKQGLSKSTSALTQNITQLFTHRKLDQAAVEELEELLIMADLGHATAHKLVAEFAASRFGRDVTASEIKEALAAQIEALLQPVANPLVIDESIKPYVLLMVGVNGAGKTTTIGKMAAGWHDQGKKVLLAAGDTFRAAAVAQLKVWGERAGCDVFTTTEGGDAAALAYKALEAARAQNADLLLIDTAGRLQNKQGLMEELAKIKRVLQKLDPSAPHSTLLVLDATSGQNAYSQLSAFKELVQVDGLVVTKLDGSAKGGVVVGLAEQFKLPIVAVGVGETLDDLQPFEPREYARALLGLV
jgi:fused signal recognition particle receptor